MVNLDCPGGSPKTFDVSTGVINWSVIGPTSNPVTVLVAAYSGWTANGGGSNWISPDSSLSPVAGSFTYSAAISNASPSVQYRLSGTAYGDNNVTVKDLSGTTIGASRPGTGKSYGFRDPYSASFLQSLASPSRRIDCVSSSRDQYQPCHRLEGNRQVGSSMRQRPSPFIGRYPCSNNGHARHAGGVGISYVDLHGGFGCFAQCQWLQ